jgi:hypothetical protein
MFHNSRLIQQLLDLTQVHGLSECFAFGGTILQGETKLPDQLKSIWTLWSHVSEKFVQSCNLWTLKHIAVVIRQLLVITNDKIPESLWTGNAFLLTSKDHEVILLLSIQTESSRRQWTL